MWQLLETTATQKIYKNTNTGSEVKLDLIYEDSRGNKWYSFNDLFTIPLMREIAAKKITELYGTGISHKDLLEYTKRQKEIIKSPDPEKYEKLYAELLQMESAINMVGDPTKQLLSLATVYILSAEEKPDIYDQKDALNKMEVWKHDPEAMVFFLNWLTDTINSYLSASGKIGQIVSAVQSLEKKGKPYTTASKR